jgi:predicted amidohydrolase
LRFAILICSDSGIPGIFDELAGAGCDVVLLPCAGAGSVSMGLRQAELGDPEQRAKYSAMAAACVSRESIEQCWSKDLCVVACNQAGWDAATGYFHPGGSSIIDRTGAVSAVIPPRFVVEHVRAELAVGIVSRKPPAKSRMQPDRDPGAAWVKPTRSAAQSGPRG